MPVAYFRYMIYFILCLRVRAKIKDLRFMFLNFNARIKGYLPDFTLGLLTLYDE